jgi:hypothetical protein
MDQTVALLQNGEFKEILYGPPNKVLSKALKISTVTHG